MVEYIDYPVSDYDTYTRVARIIKHNNFVRLLECTTYAPYKERLFEKDIQYMVSMLESLSGNDYGVSEESLTEYVLQDYLQTVVGIKPGLLYCTNDCNAIKDGIFEYQFDWANIFSYITPESK